MDKPKGDARFRPELQGKVSGPDIYLQAALENEYENFRQQVERAKTILLTKKSVWDKLFPFSIKIERK